MANINAPTTVVGNLTADPELRYVPGSNNAVVNARIASTPRKFDKATNQWEDGEPLFLTFNAWRNLAENVAASLSKGMRVIVVGNLTQRSYQTNDGDSRTVYEIEATAVGPDLTFATAHVTKATGGGGSPAPQGGYGGQQAPAPQQGGFNAGNGQQQPQGGYPPQQQGGGGYPPQQQQGGGGWGQAAQPGGYTGGFGG
jgi:single-strand DNA-binding protein